MLTPLKAIARHSEKPTVNTYLSLRRFGISSTRLLALTLAVTSVLTAPLPAWSADREVLDLVWLETKANAAGTRSNDLVAIEHFEIPLSKLEADVAERIPADVRDSLIFEKDGQKHVRWIINPEDSLWYKDVEKWLKSQGLSTQRHKHFNAYMTASRSYIIEDPVTKAQFSAKVSTNQTGGAWKDKKQPIDDAAQVRMANDFIDSELKKAPLQHAIVMDEPAMFGIKSVDQAMLVRTLAELTEKKTFYIPGFAAVHHKAGAAIAKKNGSNNPAAFWNEHYNKPLARALAEAAARFGLTYDSPHSQNFLVELDENMKPTGKIVLRDIGDSYASEDFFKAKKMGSFLNRWEPDNIVKGGLSMAVGVLHGNEFPSWMSEAEYMRWGNQFYEEFEKTFSSMTGIPKSELNDQMWVSGRYFSKTYQTHTPGWKNFLAQQSPGAVSAPPASAVPDTLAGHFTPSKALLDRKCQQIMRSI